MKQLKQVRFCGLGGQGIVMMGTMLGKAAIIDGKWVSGSNAYGSQARGGHARSEVVISNLPITYPHVLLSDILVVLSQVTYEKFRQESAVSDALIFYEPSLVKITEPSTARQVGIAAIQETLNKLQTTQASNVAMLSAVNSAARIVSFESLQEVIEASVPPQTLELNLKALKIGKELGEKIV